MIHLEVLNDDNENKLMEIQRKDIPISFVEEVNQTIKLAKYGAKENLKGHCYGILSDLQYVGVLLIGEGIEDESDPPEVKGHMFYRIIGFVIDQRFRNLGIGSEALNQAISNIFEEYGSAPVLLECNQQNHKAIAFYKKLGFVNTKLIHHEDVYLLYPLVTLEEFSLREYKSVYHK